MNQTKKNIRQVMQAYINKVKTMSEDDKEKLVELYGLKNPEGHTLSGFNHAIILAQWREETFPSVLAGFRQWQRYGNTVKKGQHAVYIAVPLNRKKENDNENEDDENEKIFFSYKPVFDITQTIPIDEQNQ